MYPECSDARMLVLLMLILTMVLLLPDLTMKDQICKFITFFWRQGFLYLKLMKSFPTKFFLLMQR